MSTTETILQEVADGDVTTAPEEVRTLEVPVAVASGSHVGHKREHNEDALLVDRDRRLFAISDGMGGPPAGEVASALTIAALDQHVAACLDRPDCRTLVDAIDRANADVVADASRDEDRKGMGATVVACQVTWDGRAVLAHSGDSRAYLLRRGALQQLTHDHVRIERRRRLLTRCVGRERGARPDVVEIVTEPGDRVLLCSDGLTDMVGDDVIAWLLGRAEDPAAAVAALVEAALEAGGRDNVTVIVIDVATDDAAMSGA